MKVWSKSMLLLVMTASAAGWMTATATNPTEHGDPSVDAPYRLGGVASAVGVQDSPPPKADATALVASRVTMVSRADRSGVSDLSRRSRELIESQRHKPTFGEWSLKYMIVDDALRADINQDGWLTSEDLAQFITWMQQGDMCADMNADGLMDALDVEMFVEAYATEQLIEVRRDATRPCTTG